MVQWEGASQAHVTSIPRKPTPLGYHLRTLVCGHTSILLALELCEAAAREAQKEFVGEHQPHTAVCLRMTKPWWHTGRALNGDSYFGSLRTAMALHQKGIFTVMNVKRNSARYPKAQLLAEMRARGDTAYRKVAFAPAAEGDHPLEVYASAHMDKQPLLLVHTMSHTGPGEERTRYRHKYVRGAMTTFSWRLL